MSLSFTDDGSQGSVSIGGVQSPVFNKQGLTTTPITTRQTVELGTVDSNGFAEGLVIMGYISSKDGSYYEGDKQYGDIDVPQRPSPKHIWQNENWFLPPPTQQEIKAVANKVESDLSKADAVSQYIDGHTIAEIAAYVKTDVNADGVTNLATAVIALKKIENLIIKLAALHKIKD